MPGPTRGWGYKLEQLETWWNEGRIHTKKDGTPRMDGLKVYLHDSKGKPLQNIWTTYPEFRTLQESVWAMPHRSHWLY